MPFLLDLGFLPNEFERYSQLSGYELNLSPTNVSGTFAITLIGTRISLNEHFLEQILNTVLKIKWEKSQLTSM